MSSGTYLVTGAAGFIGTNFLYYLRKTYPNSKIVAIDNLSFASNIENLKPIIDRITFHKVDICNYDQITQIYKQYKPDYVINFAAESHNDRAISEPTVFMHSNAIGAQIMLEVSRKNPVKTHLHVSTIEVYGELPPGQCYFDESSSLNAKTPYSAAKAAGDMIVRAYMCTYPEMNIALTHCANNYGPYQFPEKLIPVALTQILSNKKVPIYGDGKQMRDWLHVDDHCRAIDLILHKDHEISEEALVNPALLPIFDISARHEVKNIDIIAGIAKILDKNLDDIVNFVPDRPNHDRRYLIDPKKIETTYGWKPQINFDDGLEQTVKWYLDNPHWWNEILSRKNNLIFETR